MVEVLDNSWVSLANSCKARLKSPIYFIYSFQFLSSSHPAGIGIKSRYFIFVYYGHPIYIAV